MHAVLIIVSLPAGLDETDQGWVDHPGWFCSRKQSEVCASPGDTLTLFCGGCPSPSPAVLTRYNYKEK
jgi:hypothetical protein